MTGVRHLDMRCGVIVLWSLFATGCGDSRSRAPTDSTDVMIVTMRGGDTVTAAYVDRLLRGHGVRANTVGSIGWSTSVPRGQRDEARSILLAERGLSGYIDWLDASDGCAGSGPVEPPLQEVVVGRDYDAAMAAFPAASDVGRILRHASLRALAQREAALRVERMQWRVRPFITAGLKRTTAVDATVVLSGANRSVRSTESGNLRATS